ncbi:hypothetical protein [Aeromicrobium ginsengisoli]|uniref:GGDEF domain-containing protein n=1 Tax=Aeromicrobium ginsengisoli TaxID=363867 RepID=A0A5M4FEI4_9ACTN|nr:hypothetical protein [Aeromicrobium ginsengisoli]KAA1397694.1 hypothetical protein ESP70_010085 [Aeromicrobium ginsengisoli]
MFSSGVDDVLLADAVRDGRPDVADVALVVGASAARLGVPLHEVMDHVERAFAGQPPSFEATRAAVLAWADEALVLRADISCEDPLTSLATTAYVRSRLAEIYRGAERDGHLVAHRTVLVVVELPRASSGHELEQSLRALDVAEAMRAVFAGDETVARVSPRRFAALVGRGRADVLTLSMLRILLERALGEDAQPRLWVEELPPAVEGVARVLAGLSE